LEQAAEPEMEDDFKRIKAKLTGFWQTQKR
jgi:hypothetical protein